MPEQAGRVSLKPSGSFVSQETIRDGIDASKASEAVNQAQTDSEKARKDAADQKRIDEINKLLPEEVFCVLGKVSFRLFKQIYKTVWDQVENKDHLARGYVICERELSPGLPVQVRSFRTKEMRTITQFSPVTSPEGSQTKLADETFTFRNVRLALGVVAFGGRELPGLPMPESDLESWKKLQIVKGRLEMFDNFSEEIVDGLAGLITDTIFAYRLALQENLKNRYAPL